MDGEAVKMVLVAAQKKPIKFELPSGATITIDGEERKYFLQNKDAEAVVKKGYGKILEPPA